MLQWSCAIVFGFTFLSIALSAVTGCAETSTADDAKQGLRGNTLGHINTVKWEITYTDSHTGRVQHLENCAGVLPHPDAPVLLTISHCVVDSALQRSAVSNTTISNKIFYQRPGTDAAKTPTLGELPFGDEFDLSLTPALNRPEFAEAQQRLAATRRPSSSQVHQDVMREARKLYITDTYYDQRSQVGLVILPKTPRMMGLQHLLPVDFATEPLKLSSIKADGSKIQRYQPLLDADRVDNAFRVDFPGAVQADMTISDASKQSLLTITYLDQKVASGLRRLLATCVSLGTLHTSLETTWLSTMGDSGGPLYSQLPDGRMLLYGHIDFGAFYTSEQLRAYDKNEIAGTVLGYVLDYLERHKPADNQPYVNILTSGRVDRQASIDDIPVPDWIAATGNFPPTAH